MRRFSLSRWTYRNQAPGVVSLVRYQPTRRRRDGSRKGLATAGATTEAATIAETARNKGGEGSRKETRNYGRGATKPPSERAGQGDGKGLPKGTGAERGDKAERGARKTGARVREGQEQSERAQGESSGRMWGSGHRVRKGEGSLGWLVRSRPSERFDTAPKRRRARRKSVGAMSGRSDGCPSCSRLDRFSVPSTIALQCDSNGQGQGRAKGTHTTSQLVVQLGDLARHILCERFRALRLRTQAGYFVEHVCYGVQGVLQHLGHRIFPMQGFHPRPAVTRRCRTQLDDLSPTVDVEFLHIDRGLPESGNPQVHLRPVLAIDGKKRVR
eukprot:1184957-Prorocentrum_minimum.AAC.4